VQDGVGAVLLIQNQEMIGSNLVQDIDYPDGVFSWFSSVQTKAGMVAQLGLTTFSIILPNSLYEGKSIIIRNVGLGPILHRLYETQVCSG
jgi:hypothetical protein